MSDYWALWEGSTHTLLLLTLEWTGSIRWMHAACAYELRCGREYQPFAKGYLHLAYGDFENEIDAFKSTLHFNL